MYKNFKSHNYMNKECRFKSRLPILCSLIYIHNDCKWSSSNTLWPLGYLHTTNYRLFKAERVKLNKTWVTLIGFSYERVENFVGRAETAHEQH